MEKHINNPHRPKGTSPWKREEFRRVRKNKTSDSTGINATSSKLRGGVENKKPITVPFTKGDKGANKNERRRGIKKRKLSLLDKREYPQGGGS
jgi:hypothetical protein